MDYGHGKGHRSIDFKNNVFKIAKAKKIMSLGVNRINVSGFVRAAGVWEKPGVVKCQQRPRSNQGTRNR